MNLSYNRYLDAVLGGWLGKSMGGAIGARFEGNKGWIEVAPDALFPAQMPPNDDLDLQVLWLHVLEQRGSHLSARDLAGAWLEGCWYPFNEYGIFRRNWRLGIAPPMSGRFGNQFWDTGMGCPIRAEIWGYTFPGAPDLAAHYAGLDGSLDHTEESIGAEKMFAAMASMAFFVPDVRRLAAMFTHYLPASGPTARGVATAFECFDAGVSLRDARDRIMARAGNPEACDARTNVPFTFLGLLYGGGDLLQTLLDSLRCGYDTDCTMATAGALIGQILGARALPSSLLEPVGDELVMGIEYTRPEMTISALARDTARVGVLLSRECNTGIHITDAPDMAPFPPRNVAASRLELSYLSLPCVAPGETVRVQVSNTGAALAGTVRVDAPVGWVASPASFSGAELSAPVEVTLHAPRGVAQWPMQHRFSICAEGTRTLEFGVAGAGLWQLLGVFYDAVPDESDPKRERRSSHHFVSLEREYLPEPGADVAAQFAAWSQKLGRPAVVPSYEYEVDFSRLIGLSGPCCVYLARTVYCPDEREANLVVGNSDGYRIYLNGERIAHEDDTTMWAPYNEVHAVRLRQGANHLLLKLLRRTDSFHFTLGIRDKPKNGRWGRWFNAQDWAIDLCDAVPLQGE